jgi:PAS domain S-box-containing protein
MAAKKPDFRSLLTHALRVACVACLLASVWASASGETSVPGTLRVISDDNFPPYLFRDADGKQTGYLVDLWALWSRKTGVPVQLTATNWAEAQARLLQGDADVIDMIYRTPSREPLYDFSAPYADLPVSIYSHTSISGIHDVSTLRGFQIGVQQGDACIDQLLRHGIQSLKYYRNYAELIGAAKNQEIKLFCLDESPANFYLYQLHAQEAYRKAFQLYQGQFHRAVRKGKLATLALVEDGMTRITEAERDSLREKWLGTPLRFAPHLRALGLALLILLGLGGVLALWTQLLRRQVAARTRELNHALAELSAAQRDTELAKAHLAATLQAIPDLLFELDGQGRYLDVYASRDSLLAAPKSELIGRHVDEVLPAAAAAEVHGALAGARRTGSNYGRLISLEIAGEPHWFELSATCVRSGTPEQRYLVLSRDVTHRIESERALALAKEAALIAAGNQRFRALFEAAPMPLVYLVADQLEVANARFYETFGYARDELPTLEEWWQLAYPDPDYRRHARTEWEAEVGKAMRENCDILAHEYRIQSKDGHQLVMLISGRMLDDGLLATFIDVTHSRQLADQLRISEERLSLALDASNDGLWDWNIETGELYCNTTYFRMLGYPSNALENRIEALWLDLLHPADHTTVLNALAEMKASAGHFEQEFRLRAADGSYRWILSRGQVVSASRRGAASRAVGTHTDLTERKTLEFQLQDAYDEQRAIFNAASVGIVLVRAQTIERCNSRLEEIFAYAPGEFNGRSARSWFADDASFESAVNTVFSPRCGTTSIHETQLVKKDGSLFWARLHGQVLDPGAPDRGAIMIVEDISIEQQAMATLHQAREAAEAATRSKSEFLANMSHEIRTPMNAILGLTYLLRREPLAPQQAEKLDKIATAGRHLQSIINDVLDFSKIEAGRLALDARELDPQVITTNVVSMLTESAQQKGISLRAECADLPACLLGDATRLTQAYLNLASNAVKFTEEGSVVLRTLIERDEPEDVVLRFEVSDTGIGIEADTQRRLFAAFEQGDASTTRNFGGTGLGLVITQRLASLMGGATGVRSEPGAGSTFWFSATLAKIAAPALSTLASENDAEHQIRTAFSGTRILLVEDDEFNQEVAEEFLASAGLLVDLAVDGVDAIAKFDAAPPGHYSLILMDMQMPRMGGIEATRQLRAQPTGASLPIIAMTANAFSEDRERCLEAGMNDFIAKPINPKLFCGILLKWLRAHAGDTDNT